MSTPGIFQVGVASGSPTLPTIITTATDWPACAKLSTAAPTDQSAAAYIITWDTIEGSLAEILHAVGEETRDDMSGHGLLQPWRIGRADRARPGTALMQMAAAWQIDGLRNLTAEQKSGEPALGIGEQGRGQQRLGVGMQRSPNSVSVAAASRCGQDTSPRRARRTRFTAVRSCEMNRYVKLQLGAAGRRAEVENFRAGPKRPAPRPARQHDQRRVGRHRPVQCRCAAARRR